MTQGSVLTPGAIALVVGASSGIGAAVARQLAERGCRVILASRRRAALEALNAVLKTPGHAIELDVTDPRSTGSLLDRLPAGWRDIAIMVYATGHDIGGRERFDQRSDKTWLDIVEANLNGAIRLCRLVIPGMLGRGAGHIVTLGSIAGTRAVAGEAAYNASKFGLHGLSEALRIDFKGTGVRVTEVLPGLVRTNFAETRWGDAKKAATFYGQMTNPLGADDVARSVVFALDQPPHVSVSQILIEPSEAPRG
jgi:NADP-dependent 3-hydroxy acid dehydrogenase YdfG